VLSPEDYALLAQAVTLVAATLALLRELCPCGAGA